MREPNKSEVGESCYIKRTRNKHKIVNLMKAIEDGLYTRTTKERLEALEIQKDELTVKIADEKLKKPSFNEDFIRFWLMKFRKFDISQKKSSGRRRLKFL